MTGVDKAELENELEMEDERQSPGTDTWIAAVAMRGQKNTRGGNSASGG